ncbi:ImmA/IrrE family metallo-endopeptidase [Phycicoccus endophyticus]|uniref:ImmA/IrrE family metallo-endopeptidase n=1 Tax=Phycicoccus endophyticus TaxID=1690220 RepID=A0A7G9R3K2_9MICO|nr:ImmA/IrrE family metallo-endopeptidase [Phycicoccus endophyticus]NHI19934.1 ImmA/IrrE family metallo-endopeptidase [Phycicoccus endophyticus]QNN50177.1 ImmA/IrrE family metallo-endopeptidase [Phycicoccus endophyticus]GGL27408.1 hypothetical protein GCM10012283_06990 [Phycicoccus endophyticus]
MTGTYLHWRSDLPPYLLGATDGERIWMRSDLSQVERRCVLAHELAHLEHGHSTCQPGPVEDAVDRYAARYLLPDPRVIADALVWAGMRFDEAADVLWVTERLLRVRLDPSHLHPAELAIIRERVAAADFTA